jgi:hypothetical protein
MYLIEFLSLNCEYVTFFDIKYRVAEKWQTSILKLLVKKSLYILNEHYPYRIIHYVQLATLR